MNKDAYAFSDRSGVGNGDAWAGVVAEKMRCREGCGRLQIKVEAGNGSSLTSDLETPYLCFPNLTRFANALPHGLKKSARKLAYSNLNAESFSVLRKPSGYSSSFLECFITKKDVCRILSGYHKVRAE